MEKLEIDEVYSRIGEFGCRQKLYFLLIGFLGLYGPFHQLQMVFVGHDPGFECSAGLGTNISVWNGCPENKFANCKNITYGNQMSSVVTTWNLVCDRAYLAKAAQSVYMLGTMVIGLPGGRLSDKFGRKRVVVTCILLTIVCSGMQAFVHDYRSYLLSKFFQGCFYAGTIPSFVLMLELLGPSKRGSVGTLSGMWFSLGIMLLSGIAYFVRDWRELVLVINLGGLIVPAALLLLPESPRWLLLHGREEEAKAVWADIARGNGKKFDPTWNIVGTPSADDIEEHASSLLWNPALRRITFIQILSWFTNSVVYYGLALAAGNFGKDLYYSSALSGAVEIPGTLLLLVVFLFMGRCAALGIFMIGSGIACVVIEFLPQNEFGASTKFILGLVGKLGISASFSVIYIHSTEIYPTRIRTAALGFFFMSSRIGSVVAPFVGLADSLRRDLQFTIYGVLGIVSGLLNLMLPETAGRPMPQTMSDLVHGLNREIFRSKKSRIVQLSRNGLSGLRDDEDEEELAMVPLAEAEDQDEVRLVTPGQTRHRDL